jgi:hypothetical protein
MAMKLTELFILQLNLSKGSENIAVISSELLNAAVCNMVTEPSSVTVVAMAYCP